MKLEIRNFTSPQIKDLEAYEPSNIEDLKFLLEMEIGPVGREEVEIFTIKVVSPYAVREHGIKPETKYDKFVFVNTFNWPKLKNDLINVVNDCNSDTLEESIEKLQSFFTWLGPKE